MRRSSKASSHKLSAESLRLNYLAQAMMQSGSRLEERAWERGLDLQVQKLLRTGHQDTIDASLDMMFAADPDSYDALMQSLEACSGSCAIEKDGASYDALLIAVPILAWTRFSIPSGPIPSDMTATLSAHLYAHVLAEGTRLAMAPTLYSIDQLPRNHAQAYAMTHRMAQAALDGTALRPSPNPEETAPFLADTRFLLAVVAAPAGGPLFRWQATEGRADAAADKNLVLEHWQAQAKPNIERLLPGCGVELLLPDAYYVGCREADIRIRPISIRAAVHYLAHALGVEPSGLSAIVGGFCDVASGARVDEYRVSFTLRREPDVLYGVVWPLYGQEEDDEDPVTGPAERLLSSGMPADPDAAMPIDQIMAVLRASGVADIKRHTERFPMEFCDDCGAPLFCDAEGELVHAEMPEDAPQASGHLH